MQVGQRVKLNPNVTNYRYGRGPVGYDEIGVITSIGNDEVLTINFPSHHFWSGVPSDLISAARKLEDGEIAHCRDCGRKLNSIEHEIDGEYLCEDCFQEKYFYCDECGKIEEKENGYLVNEEKWVCQSCLDDYYDQCNDCGNYFRRYEGYTINTGYGDCYEVCDECYSNGDYSYCDNCGNYYESDYCTWHNDCCYCEDCYQETSSELYDYHCFNDWELFKGKNEENPTYYIGKEIELEPKGHSNVSRVIEAINNNINAVGMHDGSLADGGVEVVTHPESWQYLQEHKQDYINFFDEINQLDYGNDGGCGLHFHVSKPNDEVISRVIVLLESFKDEIKKLSRRSESQLRSWAKFLSEGCSEKEQIKYQSTKWLKEKYIKQYHDRYYALNLTNSKTIEFRFFNGVNTFEQYWAALQFIHNLMELALNEKREIETINWQDLLEGDELREQARKRDVLDINKFAKNTNEIIETLEAALDKAKGEIKNTLKNLAKYINKEMSELDLKAIKAKNIEDIDEKINQFMNTFSYRKQYLERITQLYGYLSRNDIEISTIKDYWENTKRQYPNNTKRYSRYNKLIEKTIKNYESEVR